MIMIIAVVLKKQIAWEYVMVQLILMNAEYVMEMARNYIMIVMEIV